MNSIRPMIGAGTRFGPMGYGGFDAGRGKPGALTTEEREELGRLRREVKTLRLEREILKEAAALLREGERVKFAFIHAEGAKLPTSLLCRALKVSRSGLCAWSKRPPSRRDVEDARLVPAPAWLPAARIDKCWETSELVVTTSWTQAKPSDHRAVE